MGGMQPFQFDVARALATRSVIDRSLTRSKPWNRLPSGEWLQLLDGIVTGVEELATRRRYELIVERSGGSEARYLHIRRGETWFGIRVAAHYPVYACSKDYFQVLLDDPPGIHVTRHTIGQVEDLAEKSMRVVADPSEVEIELQRPSNLHLSLREVAALRHRLNQRAKWTWDLQAEKVQAKKVSGKLTPFPLMRSS
jgi:hypothetical protein